MLGAAQAIATAMIQGEMANFQSTHQNVNLAKMSTKAFWSF
jgi:hypothetical protein